MKKTLLTASSNGFLKNCTRFALKTAIAIVLLLSSGNNASAQCIGPYQNFESMGQTIAPLLTDQWLVTPGGGGQNFFSTTTTSRTGRYAALQNQATGTGAALITKPINTPAVVTFYVRANTTPALLPSMGYEVDVSDDDGTTWVPIVAGTNNVIGVYGTTSVTAVLPALTTTGWSQISILGTFLDTPSFYRFRVRDTRVSGTIGTFLIDDFAWTSSVPAENLMIVAELSSAALCNVSIEPGRDYEFYDNGGKNDVYSPSQTGQQIAFIPTAGKIRMTKVSFLTQDVNDYLNVYNSATLVPASLLNPTPITLNDLTYGDFNATVGALSTRFISNAGVPPGGYPGFKYLIQAIECTIPSSFVGTATFEQSNLSWAVQAAATDYDIYQTTSAVFVPNGATVPTHTVGSAANTYSVTGLTAGTTYYYWVRSNCGSGTTSSWAGPVAVKPLCNAVNVPYIEDFNGLIGGALPSCTSADDPDWKSNFVNGNLFCGTPYTSFFTKGVNLTAGQLYRVTYNYSTNLIGQADLEVFYGTTNFTPTQGNIGTGLAYHASLSNIQTNIVNFTAPSTGVYYLQFNLANLTNVGTGALNIDNIRIEVETCLPPTFDNFSPIAPAVSSTAYANVIDDFSATLNWNVPITGVPASGYFYYVSTSPTPPAYTDTPTGSAPSNTVTLSTLSPNTRYYVWVRSNCGGQISTWSVHYATFITTNVTAPVTVRISDIEPVAASFPTLALHIGCNFNFSDSGGPTLNYSNGETHTYTFRPATAGKKLKVVFSSFNVEESYDGLMISSGDDSAGNSLQIMSSGRPAGFLAASCPAGSYRGTTSPGTIISNAANGSLSFTFTTDGSVVYSGWTATISCVTVPIITGFTPSNNSCGTAGTVVVITGSNFTGATGVSFGGVPATVFSVNGAGTQITATVPASAVTGKIRISNADAFGDSSATFTIQAAPPTTTGVEVCIGTTPGVATTMTALGTCAGASVLTFSGALTGSSLTANRPYSGNSCSLSLFAGTNAYYTATQFTVPVSGIYQFETANGGIDFFAYITTGPFVPGNCGTGTFLQGDDDNGDGLQPQLNVNLTAGVVYTLYTTTYSNGVTGSYTWTVIPPAGGGIQLGGAGVVQWYELAVGGSPLATGSNFNPVGVDPAIPDTSASITKTYYVACSANATCRTPTTFTISNPGAVTPVTQTISCTGTILPLVVASNTSPITKWQYNATDATFATGVTVDIPASASSTLTVLQIGSFAGTRHYRAVSNGACLLYSNVASITIDRAVWNGSWSVTPSATSAVEFQADYNSFTDGGSVTACSVAVTGGNVLFTSGHTLTVQNAVTVTAGTLTFEDDASLYQPNAVANAPGVYSGGNTGSITYKRASSALFKLDYSYWSTPVFAQKLFTISPNLPANYFLEYTGTAWAYVANPATTDMVPGKGYIVRAPLTFNNYGSPLGASDQTAIFVGEPNNGTISRPVIGGSGQLNLLGNPYPSGLSAAPTAPAFPATGFLTANTNLNGSLYFWTHNTPLGVFLPGQYNPNDYAIFNLSGASTPGPVGTGNNTIPTGIIASGQGFFVEGLSATPSNASFTNAMRRPAGNNQFYRNNVPSLSSVGTDDGLEKHRYWLDVTNSTTGFKQVLIGYIEGATNGLDRLYDAKMVDINSKVTIYTKVENTHLTIQGKDVAFDVNETIPLCFYTLTADMFTLKLSDFDGLFDNQNIYLEDTVLNVIHNLKDSDYTFASEQGLFETRFVLRYTTNALGVNEGVFNENTVVVYNNNQGLFINTGTVVMKNVTLYDVAGRKIASKSNVNAVSTNFTTLPKTQQVLLVKIESEDGTTVTKKVVF